MVCEFLGLLLLDLYLLAAAGFMSWVELSRRLGLWFLFLILEFRCRLS